MRIMLISLTLLSSVFSFGQNLNQIKSNPSSPNNSNQTAVQKRDNVIIGAAKKQESKKELTSKQRFALATKGIGSFEDPRNLPLSKNGKLISVDGREVEFKVPSDPQISSVCFTPSPSIVSNGRDASCAYSVPCDIASNRDGTDFTTVKYFQLVWHVMTDGGASSNIDQTRIDALMAELNADFASHNMVFCADPATFTEDAVNYTHDENTEEFSLKAAYNVTPTQVINIYVVGSMGPGGYARFPYDPNGGTSANGGIVLNRGNCNLGTHTLAHEMGHVFGLEHTFAGVDERGSCSSCYEKVRNVNGSSNTTGVPTPLGGPYTDEGDREGDWCSDTNPHDTYAYNCSTSSNPNGACDSNPWANAPVNNHMSYSFCSSQFTDQQSRRMHCMVNTYLSSWTAYAGGVCGALPPVADFSGTPVYGVGPMVTTFTNLSAPTAIITSYNWKFDVAGSGTVTCTGCTGADASFTGQTPPNDVTYTVPGLYTVSLDLTSTNGPASETKTSYVEVISPPNTCDTLWDQWRLATNTPTVYTFAGPPGNYITGCQSNTLMASGGAGDFISMSERYPSAGAGTQIGGVWIQIGDFVDADNDLQFQISIWDDATGAQAGEPDWLATPTAGGYLGGTGAFTPGLWLPQDGNFYFLWIPFVNPVTVPGSFFHIDFSIFPGDASDQLILQSTTDGEGEADNSNFVWSTATSTTDSYLNDIGLDFDLALVPLLGPWNPLPQIEDLTFNSVCDTTYISVTDTVLYTPFSDLASVEYQFSDGQVFTFGPPFAAERTVNTYFTTAGVTLDIIAISATCGRTDTLSTALSYPFQVTPDAEFTKDLTSPICNTSAITFTGAPTGMTDYLWDFGDGTVISTGTTNTASHTYPTPGTYYVSLTVSEEAPVSSDTLFEEYFEAGIPVTWANVDQDGDPTNYGFSNWVFADVGTAGDNEAISSSWMVPFTGTPADDWLITPAVGPLPADQKLYWNAFATDASFPDGYEVRISTTAQLPATAANFGTVLFSVAAENATETARSVDLSAYAGQTVYIAFVNNSTDQNIIAIDDVIIGTKGAGCSNTEQKLDFVEIIDCTVLPPVTDGNADVTSGCAPLDVTFTDVTTGGDPATSWLWNFGDGTFSTAQNPGVHTYTSSGVYNVIFESCNSGGCSDETFTITVSGVAEDASFTLSSASECQSGTDVTATITGDAGGTFSSTAGLSLNGSTGAIDVSASTPGAYVVTYTTSAGPCADVETQNITINADQNAGFNYSAASFCANGTDPTPTITGTTGGTFTSTAGLSLTAGTGAIDVSTSTPGAYTVTYTTAGPCAVSSNQSVTITAADDASFTLSAASACQGGTDVTATITGLTGGTFSSTAGLSLNTSTGAIDVSASTPGAYTVTYTTAGPCPSSSNQAITISADEDASFTLSAATVCQSGTDVTATITGTTGGTFSSTAGLSINSTSGTIDVSASTPGAYTVTYTTPGTCSSASNQAITINSDDDASFTLSVASACQNGTDITATITGTTGGTFSSTAGLSINTTNGTIDVSASTPGTYSVTYTTTGTCSANSNQSVTINADDDGSFSYASGTYCVSGTDPTPTITGLTGGTFSGTGALVINTSTGEIDLDASGTGSYVVTYTTGGSCPVAETFSVGITTAPDASFSYTGTPYCANAGVASVTFGAGASGGTFSATPAGLSINAGSGDVTLSTSTPGVYTVTNNIAAAGGCAAATSNSSITVTAADDASFTLSAASACQGAADVTASITGTTGGTFSSTAGLSINGTSGTIDVSASTPGAYTVTYLTAGTCPESSTQTITILVDEDASFTMSSASECQSGTDITATITGTTGGTFSSTAGLSINTSNGTVDVSASTPGVYTVTYTTPGTCSVISTQPVTIVADEDANFSYSSANYCTSAADPTPTITGTTGGTFSSTAGLVINATTGEIDLSASTVGSYNVTYTTGGTCFDSQVAAVTITSLDDASFSYSATSYCSSDTDPSATITGASGGTFTSTAGLVINSTSGLIDLDASTPGIYSVTYTTAGTCSNNSAVSVTITQDDDASFSYGSTSYCLAASDPTPTITGTTGGSFASTPGLVINATTGEIDVSASTIGSYTVTYTTTGICPTSSNVSVTVTANDDPSFSYAAASYCSNDIDPVAVISGTTGGAFSSTAGLVINATTGEIDLDASTPGVYSITYATAGACAANSSVSITIDPLEDATFSYASATFCSSDTDPAPIITGVTGGTFSAGAGLVIDPSTGVIDLDASTAFAYTVTYTTGGTCSNSETFNITINAPDDATFSYASTTFCSSDTDPTATITGTTGGIFSSSAGIIIDGSTGAIDVSASTPGNYVITYQTAGACPNSSTVSVDIITSPEIDPISDVTACDSYVLPAISGTNLTGSELYYDAVSGGGSSFNVGGIISSSMVLYAYDASGTCSSEESFNVTIDSLPQNVYAGPDQIVCDSISDHDLSADLTANGNGVWTVATGSGDFLIDSDPLTSVSDVSLGTNVYVWSVTNGVCPAVSDSMNLIVETCSGEVIVPTAFTPDGGDMINATWEISGLQFYPDCKVIVYNKWGSEIFNSTGYVNAWDGTYNGNPLPVGSYYYIIELNDGSEPLKGNVTIIK